MLRPALGISLPLTKDGDYFGMTLAHATGLSHEIIGLAIRVHTSLGLVCWKAPMNTAFASNSNGTKSPSRARSI